MLTSENIFKDRDDSESEEGRSKCNTLQVLIPASLENMNTVVRVSDKAFSRMLKDDILDDLEVAAQDLKAGSPKSRTRKLIIKRTSDKLGGLIKNHRDSDNSVQRDSDPSSFKYSTNEKSKGDHLSQFGTQVPPSLESPITSSFNCRRQTNPRHISASVEKAFPKNIKYRSSGGKKATNEIQNREIGKFRIRSVSRQISRERSISQSSPNKGSRKRKVSKHLPLNIADEESEDAEQLGRTRSNAIYIKPNKMKIDIKVSIESIVNKFNQDQELKSQNQYIEDTILEKLQRDVISITSHKKSISKDYNPYFYSTKAIDKLSKAKFISELRSDYEFTRSLKMTEKPHTSYRLKKYDNNKKLLVLDLDETLITSQPINKMQQLRVLIRPYAREFLKECAKSWNVVIFTAGTRKYAESILSKLDGDSCLISDLLCREQCLQIGSHQIKDLRIIEQISDKLGNVLIVDNKLSSFGYQMSNGIPIYPFTGDSEDSELRALSKTLTILSQVNVDILNWIESRYDHDSILA